MIDAALAPFANSFSPITFTPQAEALKANALALSGVIGRVTNAEENAVAVEAQKALHSLRADVEKARVATKQPALDFGRKVDEQARAFLAEVVDEYNRVGLLVGNYQQLEQAKQRAAERLKQDYNEIERRRAEAQTKCQSHEELEATNEAFDREAAALAVPVDMGTRAQGQVVREDWTFEVVNAGELFRAFPHSCKLTPVVSEIKNLLNFYGKLPGVKAEKIVKASVRNTKQTEAIEA